MKKSIIIFIILLILNFLLILTRSIMDVNGYEISFNNITEEGFENLIKMVFFGLLFILLILLAIRYKKLRIFNIILSIVILVVTMLFGLGLLVEISSHNPVYNDYASYDHFLENFKEEVGVTGHFRDPNSYTMVSYGDENNEIIELINKTTLEEYNTSFIKDKKFNGVVTINQGRYYIILDQSLTKITVEYHVDGHLYYKIYSKYYNIDYNVGKSIYDKAIELSK